MRLCLFNMLIILSSVAFGQSHIQSKMKVIVASNTDYMHKVDALKTYVIDHKASAADEIQGLNYINKYLSSFMPAKRKYAMQALSDVFIHPKVSEKGRDEALKMLLSQLDSFLPGVELNAENRLKHMSCAMNATQKKLVIENIDQR